MHGPSSFQVLAQRTQTSALALLVAFILWTRMQYAKIQTPVVQYFSSCWRSPNVNQAHKLRDVPELITQAPLGKEFTGRRHTPLNGTPNMCILSFDVGVSGIVAAPCASGGARGGRGTAGGGGGHTTEQGGPPAENRCSERASSQGRCKRMLLHRPQCCLYARYR